MKAKGILKLSFHETLNAQAIWISLFVAGFMVIGSSLVSEVALTHQLRLLDTSSYFFIDVILFVTSVFIGAQIFHKDYSNRGIAEIAIPSGLKRESLMFWRLVTFGGSLIILTFILFLLRSLGFVLADVFPENYIKFSFIMFMFVSLKSCIALTVGACLGIFTRPIIAILGTLALFSVGHTSSGLTGIRAFSPEEGLVSPTMQAMIKIFRIWNPNFLVLESLQGKWEPIATPEVLERLAWGVSALGVFLFIALIVISKKDVDAFRL